MGKLLSGFKMAIIKIYSITIKHHLLWGTKKTNKIKLSTAEVMKMKFRKRDLVQFYLSLGILEIPTTFSQVFQYKW